MGSEQGVGNSAHMKTTKGVCCVREQGCGELESCATIGVRTFHDSRDSRRTLSLGRRAVDAMVVELIRVCATKGVDGLGSDKVGRWGYVKRTPGVRGETGRT